MAYGCAAQLVETRIFFQNWPFPKEPLRDGHPEGSWSLPDLPVLTTCYARGELVIDSPRASVCDHTHWHGGSHAY